MAEIIEMPKLSDTMTEGTVGKWLKKEGDPIKVGDIIAEIETDKATMEFEAPDEGVLLKILVADGGRADCKTPIAVIGDKGEAFDESILTKQTPAKDKAADKEGADKKEKSKAEPEIIPSATPLPPAPPSGRIKSSPLARKLAHEKGIDLALISGSGPGGRIVRKDIEAAQKTGGEAWGFTRPGPIIRDERLPLSNMRRTIAKRLVESKTQMPHFYVEIEVDALPLSKLRASLNAALEEQGQKIKLSVNDFILKAATEALRKVPVLNSAWEDDAVRQFGSVHMAFAVTLPTGLITPVIRDAQSKGIQSISKDAKALASKAKEGKLKPEDYTGGTFTVSNMGMMGITRFYPIINPPQAAILGVGAAINTPVIGPHGNVEAGQRMILTLSADHRVVDGSDAARFLNELKKLIETPALLLL